MSDFIANTLKRFENTLKLQSNKGEDRIRNSKYKGSLWIKRRYNGFRLQTTSDVASVIDNEIERLHGNSIGTNKPQEYKYWYVDDYEIVEKSLSFWLDHSK